MCNYWEIMATLQLSQDLTVLIGKTMNKQSLR